MTTSEENGEHSASDRESSQDGRRPAQSDRNDTLRQQHDNDDSDNAGAADSSMAAGASRASKAKGRRSQAPAGGASSQLGTIGKVRHLKKDDGEPLWREDIQYDFLRAVFDNEKKVFTNSYDVPAEKQTFADLYIDTMARSSKTSKVLRDKLLSDREAAKSMAMVCLLVNVGRMNTTLNFFPEMRAQLRTYHAIPSLQAHQDASAYKQLQDAPRLKSILKGAAEDRSEPGNLEDLKAKDVPRSNPVNLIFLICQQASQVAELHFPRDGEFHDLIMKTNYTSASRASAFLWLIWFYLESDFTEEGCDENPFGRGVDYGKDVANQGIPELDALDPAAAKENIDTAEELEFGREKQAHRAKIIAADAQYVQDHQPPKRAPRGKLLGDEGPGATILPRIRPSKHESDLDSTRSTPPPRALSRFAAATSTGRRGAGPLKYQIFDASSPAGPSPHVDGIMPRKPRPPTAHQMAVERNRAQRVTHILDGGLRREHHKTKKLRRQEGTVIRTLRRLEKMPRPLEDSDEDERRPAVGNEGVLLFRGRGMGGLGQLRTEQDDFGEELASFSASIRRACRRLDRWANPSRVRGVVPTVKKQTARRVSFDGAFDANGRELDGQEHAAVGAQSRNRLGHDGSAALANGDVAMQDADDAEDAEDADEIEQDVSGGDEDLDDIEKGLLGLDSDVSEA